MTVALRPYQQEAVDALFAYFARAKGDPLVVLPTGAGKSLVLAELCRRACSDFPGTRVLVATHRAELIGQDAAAIRRLWPDADVGVYSAGMGMRQIRPVTVAGVQSICSVDGLPPFDLVVVDEAHLIPKDGDGQYRTLLKRCRANNPAAKLIGLTATPYRLSGGRLTRGRDRVFSSICYELPVQRLVDEGHLAPLVTPPQGHAPGYSTSGVAVRGGDFAPGELGKKVEAQAEVTRAALAESARLASERRSWLVYCCTVEHARQAAQELFSLGIAAHVVTGEDDPGSRKWKIDAYKAGEVRALVSVDVLTTGFDAPRTDCVVLLRPTQSTGLYVQVVGRGMRLSPETGKADCLVLDYGGNIERHGPITAVSPKESKEKAAPGIKYCPRCDAEVAVHKRACPECGAEFPRIEREVDHETKATARPIMGPPPEPEWRDVHSVRYERHEPKRALVPCEGCPRRLYLDESVCRGCGTEREPEEENRKPPSVRVTYVTSNVGRYGDVSEWVCPEHGGYAAAKFVRWWLKRGGQRPIPANVDEAVERAPSELRGVEAIVVEKDGNYHRIKDARLAPLREPGQDDGDKGVEVGLDEATGGDVFAGDDDGAEGWWQ